MIFIKSSFATRYFGYGRRGIALLPIVLLVGAIALEIVAVGGTLSFFGSDSNLSIRSSQEAFYAARAGAHDALLKLARNKGYSTQGLPGGYYSVQIASGNSVAVSTVSVRLDTPLSGQATIVSTSTVRSRTKSVRSVVNVNSITGKVEETSFVEVADN